jgi:hypothetical protein
MVFTMVSAKAVAAGQRVMLCAYQPDAIVGSLEAETVLT